MTRFVLVNGDTKKRYGRITFNGKFVFDLSDDIDVEHWNKTGFIKLPSDQHHIESVDLFAHLNARLPITLRDRTNEEKLDYIKRTGLRVASDSFYLELLED